MGVDDHILPELDFQGNLLIGVTEVERGELFPIGELCEQVFGFRNQIPVQFRYRIHSHTEITADSDRRLISLENCDDRCRPLSCLHRLQNSLILQALELPVDLVPESIRNRSGGVELRN